MTIHKTFKPSIKYSEFIQLMERYQKECEKGKKTYNNPYKYRRVFNKGKKK